MDASIENAILKMLESQGETLRDQADLLRGHGESIARVEENLRNNTNRLFGNGQPGIIQHLFKQDEDMKACQKELEEKLHGIEKKKAYILGYASCGGSVLTLAATWAAKKLGLHF